MLRLRHLREGITRYYGTHGRYSRKIDRLNRSPLLRTYIQRFPNVPDFPSREAMWSNLAARWDGTIDYLEFGVHTGHSILHWASCNRAPESRFFGFDSFEGLPERWNAEYPMGHFDMHGIVPATDDERVHFIKGMFQDTLPNFLRAFVQQNARRVVHIDCDLYSSSLYCLTQLDPLLVPGTLLILDEFGDVLHEFRALMDYAASYRREFRLVATHSDCFTAAVEVV